MNLFAEISWSLRKALLRWGISSEQRPLIKGIWYDPKRGHVFIHTGCRSGLFTLPVDGAEDEYSYWLADMWSCQKLPRTETIYRLMDVRKGKPPQPRAKDAQGAEGGPERSEDGAPRTPEQPDGEAVAPK